MNPVESIEVAGCVSTKLLVADAKDMEQAFIWARAVIEVMDDPSGKTFCGIDLSTVNDSASPVTSSKYSKTVNELASSKKGSNVVREVNWAELGDRCRSFGNNLPEHELELNQCRAYISVYFQVPKTAETDRPILALGALSKLALPPTEMSMLSIEELLGLFFVFDCMHVAAATGDFRHSFFQYSIPVRAQRLFGFSCEAERSAYLFIVLPMGFSWAPAAAQAAVMLMWMRAIKKVGASLEGGLTFAPFHDNEDIPGAWKIFHADKLVAVIVVWIDNSLVLANHPTIRDALVAAGAEAAAYYGFRWKKQEKVKGDGVFSDIAAYDAQEPVDFIGVQWMRLAPDVVQIKHVQKNIEKWRLMLDFSFEFTADVAAFVGVIMWDAHIRDPVLAGVARAVRIAATVARCIDVALKEDLFSSPALAWKNMRVVDTGLVRSDVDYLKAELRRILANAPICRRNIGALKLSPVLLAADSSGDLFGGVILAKRLAGDKIFSGSWVDVGRWGGLHPALDPDLPDQVQINMKETLAGIILIMQVLDSFCVTPREIRLVTDNTSAEAWLRRGLSGHEKLDDLLNDMHSLIRKKQCRLVVLGIEGCNQVADEPSRGVLNLDLRKRAVSFERLSAKLEREKRGREED